MQALKNWFALLITVLIGIFVLFHLIDKETAQAQTAELNPVVRSASRWDTSPPLRDLAHNQPEMRLLTRRSKSPYIPCPYPS